MKLKQTLFTLITTGLAGSLAVSPALAAQTATEVTTKGGIEAEAEGFSFELGGRIQLDYALFDEDQVEMTDGFEFRRARLFVAGTLYDNWDYKAQYDLAGNEVTAKDLYIKYTGLESGQVTIGQFKQPFGLEELTSSKYITFMERSVANAFSTGRRIGVGYSMANDSSTFAASVYGQEAATDVVGDQGMGVGARYTFLPMKSDDSLLHLGVAAALEEPADSDAETVRFRERPEAHLAERLVNTGAISDVDQISKLGLEAAWVNGPFSLQGEYMLADVARKNGQQDVGFDGYYVFGSFFLDGVTSRPYKKGSFGRVKANGVWEIALRYSNVNMDDAPLTGGIAGGELTDITLGANYYVNPNLRFMFNYVMAEAEDALGNTEEPNVFQVRASFDF